MKIRDVMNSSVIKIHPEESVAVAARTLQRYNIGALPVCGSDGLLQGMVTDRDLVVRCMAAEGDVQQMTVGQVMTRQVVSATPDMDTGAAAHLMGRAQVRRLPVVQQGKLCGMITLGDLARRENTNPDAADALGDICSNISQR
jgi:CBS domain-containing protein